MRGSEGWWREVDGKWEASMGAWSRRWWWGSGVVSKSLAGVVGWSDFVDWC